MTNQIVIAHRGASGQAPENTLLSFQRAMILGAQMIELDIHETLDGEIVCIHDSIVDRTTNGSGAVQSFKYKELRELDAGLGQHIPTLDEALSFASGRIKVNIELKVIGIEDRMLEIVKQNGMISDILVSSFFHRVLITINELSEKVSTALLINKPKENLIDYALEFKVNAINPHHKLVNPELLLQAHETGLSVYPWTINDAEGMKNLYTMGVDGLITDYPERAVAVLRGLSSSQSSR